MGSSCSQRDFGLDKKELVNIDRMTRKIMTMNKALHPRANTGGIGLKSAEETIRTGEHRLSDYIKFEDKGFDRFLTGLIKER